MSPDTDDEELDPLERAIRDAGLGTKEDHEGSAPDPEESPIREPEPAPAPRTYECDCGATYDTEQGLIVHRRQWCDLSDENDVPPERDDAKPIDEVYRDRNLLACALVASNVGMGGWTPADGPDDDADSDEWAVVWIETPMGQCSWHVPRDMAESLLHRNDQVDYDGHDRPTKNDRLASWTQEGAWR